jgi:hypothetical protein
VAKFEHASSYFVSMNQKNNALHGFKAKKYHFQVFENFGCTGVYGNPCIELSIQVTLDLKIRNFSKLVKLLNCHLSAIKTSNPWLFSLEGLKEHK